MTMQLKLIFCLLMVLVVCSNAVLAQNKTVFGKAVYKGDLDKVERLIKAQIARNKKASTLYNRLGSSTITTFIPNLDSLVVWLKQQEGVVDAFWNKCEEKLLLYPGGSAIGVLFQLKDTVEERCFLVQEGTIGSINLFGWRVKCAKSKPLLVYKKMVSSNGFIARQRRLCHQL